MIGEPMAVEELQVPSLPARVAASTSVSPFGAAGWDLAWQGAVAVEGPQPLPWDEIRIRPTLAAIAPPFPWYARFRVKYDGIEEMRITGEQILPAHPGPLRIERLPEAVRLSYPTEPGRPYRIDYTDALTSPRWQPLEEFMGDGSNHLVADPIGQSQIRFYR